MLSHRGGKEEIGLHTIQVRSPISPPSPHRIDEKSKSEQAVLHLKHHTVRGESPSHGQTAHVKTSCR